jgi:hypothetical protein
VFPLLSKGDAMGTSEAEGLDPAVAAQVVARWWCAYDAGSFDELEELLDDDVHFQCRTDTGTTSFEEFVRAEATGKAQVLDWQTEHRLDSPYPLRHHCSNFHLTGSEGDLHRFLHYLAVTQVKDVFPIPVPGGVVEGALRDRGGRILIADLVIVLDTMDSVPLREVKLLDEVSPGAPGEGGSGS